MGFKSVQINLSMWPVLAAQSLWVHGILLGLGTREYASAVILQANDLSFASRARSRTSIRLYTAAHEQCVVKRSTSYFSRP